MPTYEYVCTRCGHEMEAFHSMKDAPLKRCPACGQRALKRLVGRGGGLIFKGSGFYVTDYKKSTAPAGETAPAPAGGDTPAAPSGAKTEPKSAGNTEGAKSAGQAEAKPAPKAGAKAVR